MANLIQCFWYDADTNHWSIQLDKTRYQLQGYELKERLHHEGMYYDKYFEGIEVEPEELTRW